MLDKNFLQVFISFLFHSIQKYVPCFNNSMLTCILRLVSCENLPVIPKFPHNLVKTGNTRPQCHWSFPSEIFQLLVGTFQVLKISV